MTEDYRIIPLTTAKQIVGYFTNTISEQDHDALDEWINASDANLIVFEDFVHMVETARELKRIPKPIKKFYDRLNLRIAIKANNEL